MKYLILLLLFVGCVSPVTRIDDIIPVSQRGVPQHETVDSVLKYYFTDKAYNAIKDIPSVKGLTFGGSYAAGVNVWTNIYAFLTRLGIGRKVVFSTKGLRDGGVPIILHEYFHHIDDMTRDGELDLISVDEFKLVWKRLSKEYPNHAQYIDRYADKILTNVFGIGEYSERMAYMIQHLIKFGGPQYVRHVYRKVIRNWE